ncbi:hypothetical protein OG978_09445 [Streptomyces sp. NBC_01591]|uniref:hypothetical protein n=1 Tax=Streptomyces sp. NBC_01591 TaxID=2975888 RepID=UPI002DD98890|nr:hypothetical protein [Streptomyces sp. NBC_01591]WSD67584.1 hypothetical protein OG978_09445 [Streptomyces sp. NBC_01591]
MTADRTAGIRAATPADVAAVRAVTDAAYRPCIAALRLRAGGAPRGRPVRPDSLPQADHDLTGRAPLSVAAGTIYP